MDTRKIVARLYPETVKPRKRCVEGSRRRLLRARERLRAPLRWLRDSLRHKKRRLRLWVQRNAWKLTVAVLVTALWAFAHIRFYNQATMLEFDIQVAWAQVEVEQERRYHIQRNLVRQILAYAQHESALMHDLTELRTRTGQRQRPAQGPAQRPVPGSSPNAGRVAPPASEAELMTLSSQKLDTLFPEIMLVAEQYPNLRLAENFQQFAGSVVATETRISERIAKYNDAVNMYTTLVRQFPGRFLSKLWGFEMYDFYMPKRDRLEFHEQRFDSIGRQKE